ncbi:hypothetical protein C2I36_00460 [Rhodobacteraceae bacterium WD3A24]|nr:hypothetical protein C2I36_00460 [Rhodobacteraceae bacterium WD3A24]
MNTEFGAALMAQARTEAQVTAALELQGYQIDDIRRSLLGRVIIKAHNEVHVREIVMSRSNGEILSDQIIDTVATSSGSAQADGGAEGSEADSGINLSVDTDTSVNVGGDAGGDADDDGGDADDDGGAGVSVGGSGGVSVGIGN